LAYIPPLWFRVMDKKLVEVTGAKQESINLLSRKKAQLIAKYQLQ